MLLKTLTEYILQWAIDKLRVNASWSMEIYFVKLHVKCTPSWSMKLYVVKLHVECTSSWSMEIYFVKCTPSWSTEIYFVLDEIPRGELIFYFTALPDAL